jgi:hypothetical protein
MRDTSEIVPARDIISGAPLGAALLSYRVGVPPRPITTIAITIEPFAHPSWVIWHTHRNRYLYRTTASTPRETPAQAVVASVETYRLLLAVADESRHAIDPTLTVRTSEWREAFTIDFVMRGNTAGLPQLLLERYLDAPNLFDALAPVAPITLGRDAATEAAALHMTTAELACSVRAEHGRWVVETGTGGMLVHHGSCASKHEAIVVAQAIRDRAWIEVVERIRIARGGSLEWGTPVVMPYPVVVYGE